MQKEYKMKEKIKYERPIIKKLNTGFTNKFGSQTKNEVVSHLEGVGVKELIKTYGSPLFVISEKQIRRNYQHAARVLSRVSFRRVCRNARPDHAV